MTELIVALDGPEPFKTACNLGRAGVRWFKIGPQTMTAGSFDDLIGIANCGDWKLFLDLKLADTEDTVREAVKRFAEAGVAAVSTFTNRATVAALRGAKGSDLRVWHVLRLTDGIDDIEKGWLMGDGVICPYPDLAANVSFSSDIDKVCPGIRMATDKHGHHLDNIGTPEDAVAAGATHIVVGRPIWQAPDPVAAAKEFLAALG